MSSGKLSPKAQKQLDAAFNREFEKSEKEAELEQQLAELKETVQHWYDYGFDRRHAEDVLKGVEGQDDG